MLNKYPLWKYILVVVVLVVGTLYALPNLFGEDPAIQISASDDVKVTSSLGPRVVAMLKQGDFTYKLITEEKNNLLLVRFFDTETQLKAKEYVKAALGDDYIVALNLAPATPKWLRAIGADPMKLGLDLRGGVHFLLQVDVNSVINKRLEQDARTIGDGLRGEKIRYAGVQRSKDNSILVRFRDQDKADAGGRFIKKQFPEFLVTELDNVAEPTLKLQLLPSALVAARDYVIDQTMSVLRKRVNALGVSEAIVQRQGLDQVVVDLPGVQDTARAKQILGGTATVELHMVDEQGDLSSAVAGQVPIGSRLYRMSDGQPILLKNRIVLSGSAIVGATSSFGEDGRPIVNIRIAGGQVSLFHRTTGDNVGKRMGMVYIETKPVSKMIDGKVVTRNIKQEKVISAPVIQSALGSNFQITGMESPQAAQNLALLLRTGALPATLTPIEESTVGPSLGQQNIDKGVISIGIGFGLIVLFMLVYYRLFGLIANFALLFNMVLVVALLSLLGATLTLAGIAGLLLTIGMAVDANVLIFERIREELRNGMSPQASINAGYAKAFSTIVDSNVTTLIVALVLFALGSGSVKGFAITLILGLFMSMFTAITGTRAIVNLIYGGRTVKQLSIGIKVETKAAKKPARAQEQ